jgi:hypothetical protein
MNFEQTTKEGINPKEAERKEKGAGAFKETYSIALKLRDFERGWGNYENKKAEPFGTLVSQIGNRCKNMAETAIKENNTDTISSYKDEITKDIEIAEEMLVRFEEREKLPFISTIGDQLKVLRENIKRGDAIRIFESSAKLSSFYEGFMYANEALLAGADEATESYNSVTKK